MTDADLYLGGFAAWLSESETDYESEADYESETDYLMRVLPCGRRRYQLITDVIDDGGEPWLGCDSDPNATPPPEDYLKGYSPWSINVLYQGKNWSFRMDDLGEIYLLEFLFARFVVTEKTRMGQKRAITATQVAGLPGACAWF